MVKAFETLDKRGRASPRLPPVCLGIGSPQHHKEVSEVTVWITGRVRAEWLVSVTGTLLGTGTIQSHINKLESPR